MNLAKFPRRRYTAGATPIEYLPRLSEHLGGPDIFFKRDDLLGLAGGGNKTRKLEFVVADALAKGADTLVTCGAVQSNHCRLTLAAAVKEGLKCHLVIEERVKDSYNPAASGNNFLFRLMGLGDADFTVVPGGSNMLEEMQKAADKLAAAGAKPYIIVGGASNNIGALGYVAGAEEILTQCFDSGLNLDAVVTTSGSGGTHAGLIVGFFGNNSHIPVYGVNTSRKNELQIPLIHALANRTAQLLELREEIPLEEVRCHDAYFGAGYSLHTQGMEEAVKLLARSEGVLLDPVYTGKCFAGMMDLIKQGVWQKGDKVLFLHTGGAPGLYAYADYFHLV
ncbi:MAG: D-cysteine desulfhydrase [Symbiobacteriaceae bacterium]|nr:D-cysteine desulfhydrase [Symbiobacteriaceae bacterium]